MYTKASGKSFKILLETSKNFNFRNIPTDVDTSVSLLLARERLVRFGKFRNENGMVLIAFPDKFNSTRSTNFVRFSGTFRS